MFKNGRGLALGQSDCRIFTLAISQEQIDDFFHGDMNSENGKVESILSKMCFLKKVVSYTGAIF